MARRCIPNAWEQVSVKKRHAILPAAMFIILPVLLAGCPHERYTLELSVHKGVLHRNLTVEHMSDGKSGPVSAEELNIVVKAYNRKPYTKGLPNQTFTGKFTGKTPDDIGGNGSVLYYESSLGSVSAYIETFRGSDDVYEQLEARMKAIEKTAKLVRGWLKHEFGTMKDFDKLDRFVTAQLEPDAKSLAIYVWMMVNIKKELPPVFSQRAPSAATQPATTGPTSSQPASAPSGGDVRYHKEQREEVVVARILQYLLKRNYFAGGDLPVILSEGTWTDGESDARGRREELLRRALIAKAGLEDGTGLLDAVVKLVCDFETLGKSLDNFIKTTPEYKKLLKQVQARAATQPSTKPTTNAAEMPEKPDLESEAMSAHRDSLGLSALIAGMGGFSDDELVVKLALPAGVEPLKTNGQVDPKTGQLQWQGTIPDRSESYVGHLPAVCYALWASPDETTQKKQFGKLFLKGEKLIKYVAWCSGLSPAAAKQWDAFLSSLTAENIDGLLEFRFEGEEKPAFRGHYELAGFYTAISGKKPPPEKKKKD